MVPNAPRAPRDCARHRSPSSVRRRTGKSARSSGPEHQDDQRTRGAMGRARSCLTEVPSDHRLSESPTHYTRTDISRLRLSGPAITNVKLVRSQHSQTPYLELGATGLPSAIVVSSPGLGRPGGEAAMACRPRTARPPPGSSPATVRQPWSASWSRVVAAATTMHPGVLEGVAPSGSRKRRGGDLAGHRRGSAEPDPRSRRLRRSAGRTGA